MPTYIDLFNGAGGLTLGMHEAGWTALFGVDRDKMSFETYSENFLKEGTPHGQITDWPEFLDKRNHDILNLLSDSEIKRKMHGLSDCVVGGPPCQGFSVAGKRISDDPRNFLAQAFCKFVCIVNPLVFLMENVEGITHVMTDPNGRTDRVSTAEAIVNEMWASGYDVKAQVINALDFGVPQIRRRTVIVGVEKNDGVDLMRFWEALPLNARKVREKHNLGRRTITIKDAISDLDSPMRVRCPDAPKFRSSPYEKPESDYQRYVRRRKPTGSIPDSHRYPKHGEIVRKRFELIQSKSGYGRQSKKFLRSLGRYSTRKHKIHWLSPDVPSTTITSQPGDFLHPSEPRELTVREMARIQSFPDDFYIRGRYTINGPRRPFDTARCSQVGNAVPPLMAEALGLSLLKLVR